jgi:hypothetical protein
MATEVKRRRGSTSDHSGFIGAVAELTVDLTKDTVVVHDGQNQGGFPLLREDFTHANWTTPDGRYLNQSSNLSDLPNTSTARTNLGVAIGTDVQAYNAGLADIAGLTPTNSNFIVGDGTNWVAESGATALASLGAQAQDPQLDDIAALTPTDGNFIVGNGSNFITESGNTARTSLGLGTADSPTFNGLTSTGVIITDEIDTTSITWNVSTQVWNATPSEKFNNPVYISTSLDVDNGINADQHVHAGTYLKADTYLEVGTSATIGTTLNVTGATTLNSTLSVTGNTTISGTLDAPTLNTGQGDNELYAMNQNVRTSDSVTFGALTVSGATILSSTLQVDGTVTVNDDIKTADFSSWFTTTPSGFQISQAGVGDFRTLYIDELVAKAFTADVAQALAGSDILTKSVAKLNASFVVPSVGASVSITVEDLEGLSGLQVFEAGDHVRARVVDSTSGLAIFDVYGTVSNYSTVAGGTQTWDYTITYAGASNGAVGKTVNKGNILLDYGTSGSFYIERTVLDRSSGSDFTKVPYNRIVQWTNTVSGSPRAGDPDTVITVITQSGNLANLTSTYSNVSGFGFFGDNTFLTGSLLVGDLSKSGNYLEYTGSTMNVVTDTFALTAGSMTIDSTNGVVVDANNFFKQDSTFSFGGGLLSGTSSTLAISGSGASINVSTFDLDATDLDITNSNGGLIQIAHDTTTIPIKFGKTNVGSAPNYDGKYGLEIGSNNYWKVVDGFTTAADYVEFRVGTGTNFIDFNGSLIDIQTTSFNLNTANLDISSANQNIVIGTGTALITLGRIDSNNKGIKIDSDTISNENYWKLTQDNVLFKVGDGTNFLSFNEGAGTFEINTDTFDLTAGNLRIKSAGTTYPSANTGNTSNDAGGRLDNGGSTGGTFTKLDLTINDSKYIKFQFDYSFSRSGGSLTPDLEVEILEKVSGSFRSISLFNYDNSYFLNSNYVKVVASTGLALNVTNLSDNNKLALRFTNTNTSNFVGVITFYVQVTTKGTATALALKFTDSTVNTTGEVEYKRY